MYQINNRFWKAVGIIELFCAILFLICGALSAPILIVLLFIFLINIIFFITFFKSLIELNKEEENLKNTIEKYGKENTIQLSKKDAKIFTKEGALFIDGKKYINKDFELWKKNGNQTKEHQV